MRELTIISCPVFPNPIGVSKEKLEVEQPGLQPILCETCEGECWISAKKRELVKTFHKEKKPYEIMCWKCVSSTNIMGDDRLRIGTITVNNSG